MTIIFKTLMQTIFKMCKLKLARIVFCLSDQFFSFLLCLLQTSCLGSADRTMGMLSNSF